MAAIAAVAAATAAVSLTTVNHVKDAAIAASLHGQPLRASTLAAALTPADALLATLALAAFLALAWLEWRRGAVTRLLRTATDTEAFLLLTVLVAWFGHAYLNPGVLLGGDTGSHIARFLEVQRGLQSGRLALWTNYQYASAPLLWFTGPLTYVVGGALSYALNDPLLAAKLLLFSLHMLAGWLFYAWMRRLGIRAVPAMFAAVCFAGAFAHLHLFLYRGVMPQAFTIVSLVLLFYAADGLLRERGARWANFLIFSLSTASMIVNLDANLEKPMFWPDDFAPSSDRRPRVNAVDGALDRFLAIEQPQPGSLTVPAIAIRDAPAAAPALDAAPWQPAIQDYAVTLDRVRLQVTANAPGYVQLAHPWFPSITVNGAAATPIRGAIDLIVLPLGAGTSVIELQDSLTPARRVSAIASLLGLLAIAAATLLLSRRGRRAPGLAAKPG